jgi:hypothetical protein
VKHTLIALAAALALAAAQATPAQEPAAQEPAAQEPAAEEPAAEEPAAQDPAAQDPAAQDPAAQDPAAQDPAAQDPAAPEASPPTADVSDAELETFADIYVDLRATAEKYEAEITAAESPDATVEVQTRLRDESLAKIAEHGWTLDMYNMVVAAINAGPTLAEKVVQMIEERS